MQLIILNRIRNGNVQSIVQSQITNALNSVLFEPIKPLNNLDIRSLCSLTSHACKASINGYRKKSRYCLCKTFNCKFNANNCWNCSLTL